MTDTHLHSTVSHDGKSTMAEYIAAAREKNLTELTFTEHWDDYEGIETKLKTLDVPAYERALIAARETTDLPIHFGIEIGLQPHLKEKVSNLVKTYPFDFIIGSSHITRHLDMAYDPKFFEGKTRREAYMQYFEEMIENINLFDEFDIYGHLDYVSRYGGYAEKSISYDEFSEILDEIFRALIRKDKGIELNTSGIRNGTGTSHPSPTLIARYRELGGKIITLGSDAHRAVDLCADFEEAVEILSHIGFSEIAVYRNRVPHFVKLKDFI